MRGDNHGGMLGEMSVPDCLYDNAIDENEPALNLEKWKSEGR